LKTVGQISADKLRGGFYSPAQLVRACLDRVVSLSDSRGSLRIFEPSAGDGAFLRGLSEHQLARRVAEITAVEINTAEAAKCQAILDCAPFRGTVLAGSVLNGARPRLGEYDIAVGNPPFVRFQFLTEEDRRGALDIARASGLTLAGVSNLWIPVLLAALTRLRAGGAFAFIVPAESFTGISARSVRTWLIRNAESLQADLFPPGSFPDVLQDVIVLSGRLDQSAAARPAAPLRVVEHAGGRPRGWTHHVAVAAPTWTRYLLVPAQLAALAELTALTGFRPMAEVARLTVSTVTGANEYFSVTDSALRQHALTPWALPLLPRVRHAAGLLFGPGDHDDLARADCPRWLLNFARDLPSPEQDPVARRYLRGGEELGLPERYKCRIRDPWYRVPVVQPGRLLLSKRSHRFPRLVLNSAGVSTTDTIYQGKMRPPFEGRETDLVAGFHNTATLLTAEIEGRSFGGGVLELVPTEIGRVRVPLLARFGGALPELDALARAAGPDSDELIERTDTLLADAIPELTPGLLGTLRDARIALLKRRMDRSG
jgi:methylase of polypeptide subunit release factors